jgi:hypothetical protein
MADMKSSADAALEALQGHLSELLNEDSAHSGPLPHERLIVPLDLLVRLIA